MNVYFDNAATTRPFDEVVEQLSKFLLNTYGNPSSLHRLGVEAERIVKEAKEIIAKKLGSSSDEIYFTSGGTEANNLALIGCAVAHQKRGKKLYQYLLNILLLFLHLSI